MEQINNELVKKVIYSMQMHHSTTFFEDMQCYVLDMEKGFLFFNEQTACLYHAFSKIEKPSYLSSEAQRSSSIISYTIGCNDGIYDIYRLRTEEDFKELHNQIIENEL